MRLITTLLILTTAASAQGTRQWSQSRYDEFEKGKPTNVSITNEGHLGPAPATSLVVTTNGNYVWSIAADTAGNAYLAIGSPSGGSAEILKVTPDGKPSKVFESKELAFQAVKLAPDGKVYAASSPDGKVYRIDGGKGEVVFDPATTAEKPKYLWDLAFGSKGELYVASGSPAAIYKVINGKPELLFKSGDQHIRCLLVAPDGTLYAGSDGAGVIYRIPLNGKPFAVYAAPKHEITALALDKAGNLYAAGVGGKAGPALPPLQVTGNVGVTISFAQPGSAGAVQTNALVPEGSEIYKIAANGTPQKLLTLKDDVVYSLAFLGGKLVAGTGNRGHVYGVSQEINGQFVDLVHLDGAQVTSFAQGPGGLYAATSNSGRLFLIKEATATDASYQSDVFDAGVFSQWGRAEVRANPKVELWARSGNVENPELNWSDWMKVNPSAAGLGVPSARYMQWKAVMPPGSELEAVTLNYLPNNLPPVVDELVVQPGARMQSTQNAGQNQTVQINLAAPAVNPGFSFPVPDSASGPLTAQKDRAAITARWAAHDDNGDSMMFAVYYRGDGETNWHLLKDHISDKFLSWEAGQLPDGGYTLKVVASDAPEHVDIDTMTGERLSSRFEVDTTPPVLSNLKGSVIRGAGSKTSIHTTLDATDATSPIAHAEYSVDAGPWQYLEPAGKLSDGLSERYDFNAEVKPGVDAPAPVNAAEHVIAVRVYDRWENVATIKTVVR